MNIHTSHITGKRPDPSLPDGQPVISDDELNEMYELSRLPQWMADARARHAAARWACISAKSHRERFRTLIPYQIRLYDRSAEIRPIYESVRGSRPPSRENEVIHQFSKRSRSRLLQKMRRMRKDKQELPFFVTLTYHENFKDCQASKRHIDNFLKRYRRATDGELKYVWKLEFQERGAIHYHVAMFFPPEFTAKWTNKSRSANERLRPLRERIGRDWREVTAGSDDQEKYGTNVREVQNEKMMVGYMAKYIGKVQKSRQDMETGRFWAFSRNFDFSPIFAWATDERDIEEIYTICSRLNEFSFRQYIEQQKGNWKRAKKQFHGRKLENEATKIRLQVDKQKRRYLINRERIERGAMLTYEVLAADAADVIRDEIRPVSEKDYFNSRTEIWQYTHELHISKKPDRK